MACKEARFLGHIVSEKGLRSDPAKVEAITSIPIPTGSKAKTKLRSFLGVASFYRRYVKDYAKHTHLLNELLEKGVKVEASWKPEHTASFEALKKALSEPPVLSFPDLTKELIITTDASANYCGATLSYKDPDGSIHVIEYASKCFSKFKH